MKFFTEFIHSMYPERCLICGAEMKGSDAVALKASRHQKTPHLPLCQGCNPFIETSNSPSLMSVDRGFCHRCGEQKLISKYNPATCLPCLICPLPVRELRSLADYSPRVEQVVKRLKYGLCEKLGAISGTMMAESLLEFNIFSNPGWDILVPLPSSANTTRKRGFSHTVLIGLKMSEILGVRLDRLALRSSRTRLAQARLSPDERLINMQNAFCASSRRVRQKSVLLIDDVLTTGASITSAALALRAAGADQIDVLTLARSTLFWRYRLRRALGIDNSGKSSYMRTDAELAGCARKDMAA